MVRLVPLAAALLAASFTGCSEYDISGHGDAVVPGAGPTGGIAGRICGPDGVHWVVGADIVVDEGGFEITGITDEEGYFLVDEVPVGDWDVTVRRGSFEISFAATVLEDQITELDAPLCLEQGDLRIAVVTGAFDNIEEIMADMTLDADIIDGEYGGATSFLRNPSQMQQYDLIFFNCGMSDDWAWTHQAEVAQNLRDFVNNGGSIYASDWAYYIVEAGWPDMNTFYGSDQSPGDAYVGESGSVQATVLDPIMAARLGSTSASLNYDLPIWAVMEQTHQGEVLIEGTVTIGDLYNGYSTVRAPIASRMTVPDAGTVLYTTFHNERQTTVDMELLLQEIILSL